MASLVYDKGAKLNCYFITPPTSVRSEGILEDQQNEDDAEDGIPTPKHYPTYSISDAAAAQRPETVFVGWPPVLSPVWPDLNATRHHQFSTLTDDPGGTSSNMAVVVDPGNGCQSPDKSMDGETRSGRARNAAKQRHDNNAKRMRLGQGMTQQQRTREKNRIAATKCRRKQKAALHVLEENYDIVSAANNVLRGEERMLREQLTLWRSLALQHSTDQKGCSCNLVRQYNTRQAMRAAKTAMDGVIASYVDFDGSCDVTS